MKIRGKSEALGSSFFLKKYCFGTCYDFIDNCKTNQRRDRQIKGTITPKEIRKSEIIQNFSMRSLKQKSVQCLRDTGGSLLGPGRDVQFHSNL